MHLNYKLTVNYKIVLKITQKIKQRDLVIKVSLYYNYNNNENIWKGVYQSWDL